MSEVSNSDDVIDSRSIIERIEELEGDRDSYTDDTVPDYDDLEDGETLRAVAWAKENPDDAAELKALLALQSEAEGYCEDWEHGATLIRDSYFETYAQEYADDIGAIDNNAGWPMTCIDWEKAAEELQADYAQVNFDGTEYWIR